MYFRLLFAYTVRHVPRTAHAPASLRRHLQTLPSEHTCASADDAGYVDHCGVSYVWRTPALPALGGFSGPCGVSGAQETGALCPRRREVAMFDPDAGMPRINRGMVYLGACLIAGIRLAREKQVNVRVIPTSQAINESVDLAHEIFNRVFRRVPEQVK